jgi:hypothetical protein
MRHTANARFAIEGWDEKPYSEGQGLPKMTRAAVTKTFTGSVVSGSATGELRGLRGDGTSAVGHGSEHPFTLNYEFD